MGWIGICSVPKARADLLTDQMIIYFGVSCSSISTRNLKANTTVKRACQSIGSIIRNFKVQSTDLEYENPWEGILSSTMFAIRSMMYTTTQFTPSQLVFSRDAILNINQESNW